MNSIRDDQYPLVVRNGTIYHADVYKNVNEGCFSVKYSLVKYVINLLAKISVKKNVIVNVIGRNFILVH